MDYDLILRALEDAQYLLESEYESVRDDELANEYDNVLDSIAMAIDEINSI